VFPQQISARHVLLIQALSVAISNYKLELVEGERHATLNDPEKALHAFLQFSTSKLFIMGVMGQLAPQIAGRPLPDLFAWGVSASYFNDKWRSNLSGRWEPLVKSLVPLIVSNIEDEMKDVVRSTQELTRIALKVGFQIQSLKSSYNSVMSPIRDVTTV